MLNIPSTVKTLFKRDGVRKNFRVHFPNGELTDLTNENIVQESVKFTESICSQDVLKFGLTEASVIEFETVGVSNMYGMSIECGIEIDLSSLSAAQIADIASGTWDGVYVSAANSDLGYAYFRVPYGVFRVESCPRDHQAMTHRKVQAYSANPTSLQMNGFEKNKLSVFNTEPNYTPDLYKLFVAQLGYNNQQFVLDEGFSVGAALNKSLPTGQFVNTFTSATIEVISGGNTVNLFGRVTYMIGYTSGQQLNRFTVNRDKLYFVDFNGYNPDTIISNVIAALKADARTADIDLEASGFESWEELANTLFKTKGSSVKTISKSLRMLFPQAAYNTTPSTDPNKRTKYFTIPEENKAIYTRIGEATHKEPISGGGYETLPNTRCYFMIPYHIEVRTSNTSPAYYDETLVNTVDIYQYVDPVSVPTFPASFQPTLESESFRSYVNSYSLIEIMNGMLELHAMFGTVMRNGTIGMMRLSNASPESVIPGEYSKLWWDEYDVEPIGTVLCSYSNADNEDNQFEYNFGSGLSVYDMTGNEVIKALTLQDANSITDLLDALFIPYLSPVNFTPIDLTMKGLPYIEAGDYLAVAAEDGSIAYSFNMRNDISGIQVLTASIESTSGQIIESEDAQ